MTSLIIILSVILLAVVLVQLAKINEISDQLKGEEAVKVSEANTHAKWLLAFCVLSLVLSSGALCIMQM